MQIVYAAGANTNPNVKWLDTLSGKEMSAAGVGASIDLKQRWIHSEQRMVLLDATVYNAITAAIPLEKPERYNTVKFYYHNGCNRCVLYR